MGPVGLIKELWEIVPVLVLLMAGGLIAARSGLGPAGTSPNRWRIAGNLAQMFLRVLGYVVVLLTLQYFIGLRPSLGW